ncbi:DUF4062 domain-containing protein [Lysinibacillus sp. NPDC094177]|uniref:DUF4062 domain-containing protein n=1 Tax=Lysinibacillus sp. NPDC094177 TaxID=3390580 RepID=UPI003D005491
MGDKKYQVFISSTYTDLVNARAKISEQILTLYHFPIGMEMFSAGDDDQWTVITNTIDKSDYYVIILGHRYGSLADDGFSYTEKEYDYAKSKGIPIMAFIKDRNVPTSPNERENNQKSIKKLERFIEKVTQNKMCDFWSNEDELTSKVTAALFKAFTLTPQIGWIRANTIDTTKTLEELTKLSAENRELKEELESLKKKLQLSIPEILVEINRDDKVNIPFNYEMKVNKLNLYSVIEEKDVPEHLQPYITKESIDKHNLLVEENNVKIEDYNRELESYKRAKDMGTEYEITLCNDGKAKATNIFVDMYFPEEVKVIEGGIDDLTKPEIPELPKDPLQVAEEKYYEERFNFPLAGVSHFYSDKALFGGVGLNRGILNWSSSNSLNNNKNNLISFSDNELTIKCSSLMHTRKRTFSEKFLIVPKSVGDFKIEMNIICEEYTEAINKEIGINVYKESLKA